MSDEIRADFTSGNTLFATVRQPDGDVWYIAGAVFEAWGTGARTAADYDIAMTDKSGDRYVADFPSAIPAGIYDVQIFLDDTVDAVLGSQQFEWSGSGGGVGSGRVNPRGDLGDLKEDDTIDFTWDTNGVAPSTAGDIRVYKNNSGAEVTAPTGITDTRSFDGLVGVHQCTIDLSVSDFYASQANYSVVLVGAVVNGQTVNVVLATFSIENKYQGREFIKDT